METSTDDHAGLGNEMCIHYAVSGCPSNENFQSCELTFSVIMKAPVAPGSKNRGTSRAVETLLHFSETVVNKSVKRKVISVTGSWQLRRLTLRFPGWVSVDVDSVSPCADRTNAESKVELPS